MTASVGIEDRGERESIWSRKKVVWGFVITWSPCDENEHNEIIEMKLRHIARCDKLVWGEWCEWDARTQLSACLLLASEPCTKFVSHGCSGCLARDAVSECVTIQAFAKSTGGRKEMKATLRNQCEGNMPIPPDMIADILLKHRAKRRCAMCMLFHSTART